jgi:hypothetical protein
MIPITRSGRSRSAFSSEFVHFFLGQLVEVLFEILGTLDATCF